MGPKVWRGKLCKAARAKDIEFLVALQYGVQADMTDLAKKKENTPEIVDGFNRITGSISRTIREVAKRDNKPMPDVRTFEKLAKKMGWRTDSAESLEMKARFKKWYKDKKEKDAAIERFIKDKSF